jgi:hypothetical protein
MFLLMTPVAGLGLLARGGTFLAIFPRNDFFLKILAIPAENGYFFLYDPIRASC